MTPSLPRYGTAALADLLPAVATGFGLADSAPLGLPTARRWVLLLVDGLGWHNLTAAAADAPFLSQRIASRLTAGVPSTTVTSLTSLGTGLVPGVHGVVGFSSRIPQTGQRFYPLVWNTPIPPAEFQPHPTWLERFEAAGIATTAVAPARFAGSGLTGAALRGGTFSGLSEESDADDLVARVRAGALRGERSFVYTYERHLDHCGHTEGWGSEHWREELRRIDALAARLRAELPADVALIVTGDHGMIDVARADRLVVEDEPDLLAEVTMVAGEARFRQVYTDQPGAVAARWRDRLGARAWVRTREQAIDDGWFGPVTDAVFARFGDVLVAMRERYAVLTRVDPGEFNLVGMHGSLTQEEMTIPLIVLAE